MLQTTFRRITRHFLPSVCKNVQKFSTTKQNTSADQQKTSGALSTYWVDSAPTKPKTSPLNADITVDTCVIGSGISGLTTAYLLAGQGQKVAVLEDGEVCSGETSRTTGYLTWVIDDGIQNIIKKFGKDGAAVHVDSHRFAVDLIERISKEEGIDCEFRRVPTYWISRKPKSEQKGQPDKDIEAEFKAMQSVGMKEVSIVDKPPYAVDDGKCLKIERQGQFHSMAYCYGLADRIQANGGKIYTRSRVVDWKSGKEPQAKTQDGHTVKCKSLVHATNVPLQYLTIIGQLEAQRTYIVGGKVPKGKYEWCVFQDDSMTTHKPYNYGRFTKYDASHDLLLVGGQDHLVGFKSDFEERYQALEKWTKERYPDIEFNYRWSGQVEEPADLIAFIGRNPGNDNVYIITGDSGLGLTHGTLGGKLVSDLILGIPNPWEKLYDPKRITPSAMPEVIKHMIEVNAQFKDYFTGRDVSDIDQIEKGEGAVVCKGIHRYAVYKDESGKIHACSGVCTHLKGLVRWNSSEKSWDCPLHGSRFDKFGAPIHGPAAQPLSKIDTEKVLKVLNKK